MSADEPVFVVVGNVNQGKSSVVATLTEADVNEVVATAAAGSLKGVLGYDEEPKVSIDFNHTDESSIFAPAQTRVVGGRLVRVLAWYDNEWGFSVRMADVAAEMGRLD